MTLLRIVIPSKNEEHYLPSLLDSIRNQSLKDLEIVIADAKSEDNTRFIAKHYSCKVVKGGYADIGRNNGVDGCECPLICFIDADVIIPHSNFLDTSIKEFQKRKLDVAGTLQKPIPTGKKIKDLAYTIIYAISNSGILLSENTKKPLMQNLMIIKTKVHQDIGGFLPYEFAEDSIFAKMAVAKGYKFGILRDPGREWISARRFEKNGFWKMSSDILCRLKPTASLGSVVQLLILDV